MERLRKRVKAGDPRAIDLIGLYYSEGSNRVPQDYTKALELWHRAAELGYAGSYTCVGFACYYGQGVEIDKKKAVHYSELGAIGGDTAARDNLGIYEANTGNMDRALQHWMIAVGSGYANSLKKIKDLYSKGIATKDDYAKALQAYQSYLSEIKSRQRDEAAAANERYRYYY